MSKAICFLMASLDGYHEGTSPWSLDWHNTDEEFNEFAAQQLDASGALVFGRATYVGMAQYWASEEARTTDPDIARRMNSARKYVFSQTLEQPDPEWENTTLIKDIGRLKKLKEDSEKDLLILGSSVLTTRLLERGLLDELRIIVNPVILGQGRSLFETAKRRIKVELKSTRQFQSGNVLLTYTPTKE